MHASDKFSPPIEVEQSDRVPAITLSTPEQMLGWIKAERDYWSMLINAVGRISGGSDFALNDAYGNVTRQIDEAQNQTSQLISSGGVQSQFENVLAGFTNLFSARALFHSRSRFGYFVSDLSKSDPLIALMTALILCNFPINLRDSGAGVKWARAAAIAELFERNQLSPERQNNMTLDDLAKRWDTQFQRQKEEYERGILLQSDMIKGWQEEAAKFSDLLLDARASTDLTLSELKKKVSDAIAANEAEIASIRQTFKAELSLQAPTTYWDEKRKGHQNAAIGWGGAFALTSGVSAFFVWDVWKNTAEPHFTANAALSYGFLLPTIGFAFIAVWFLRILSRQLLRNLSWGSDAAERVSMVKTFLALMQMPEHVKEPDRILILSALFRQGGMPDEDGAPPNWFDLVMQRLESNKS